MNKESFLKELSFLLSDLEEDEKKEALQYYQDYFDEAGPEREQEILAHIGSPEKAASEIKNGLFGDPDRGEYTERGYYDECFDEYHCVPDRYTKIVKRKTSGGSWEEQAGYEKNKAQDGSGENRAQDGSGENRAQAGFRESRSQDEPGKNKAQDSTEDNRTQYGPGEKKTYAVKTTEKEDERQRNRKNGLLLLLLFLFFGLPLAGSIISAGFSVLTAVFGCVFGIFAGLLSLIVGGFAAVIGLVCGGVMVILSGLANLAALPIALMTVCIGFFMLGAAVLVGIVTKWGCTAVIPGLFRFCIDLVGKCVRWIIGLVGRVTGKGGANG
ncbi:MAG: DUF1700 domain-containing protein [Candidatus Choladocola sp.]|nr:DUF1700 domain-containing protein [Candidatus Choladocola sp.]